MSDEFILLNTFMSCNNSDACGLPLKLGQQNITYQELCTYCPLVDVWGTAHLFVFSCLSAHWWLHLCLYINFEWVKMIHLDGKFMSFDPHVTFGENETSVFWVGAHRGYVVIYSLGVLQQLLPTPSCCSVSLLCGFASCWVGLPMDDHLTTCFTWRGDLTCPLCVWQVSVRV